LELTQENVEKLNVAKMPDALEKELSNLRQDYRKISELYIAEQNKCGHLEARIKELEEAISKMETTQKWISVKDRPPKEGEIIYGAGKFLKGLFVLQNEEWYTKEEYDDFAFEETHGYNIDAIDFWTDPPKPPTTEDSSAIGGEMQ